MNKWLNWENNKNKLKDGDLILVEFGIKEPIHEYQSFIVKQQNNNLFLRYSNFDININEVNKPYSIQILRFLYIKDIL